MRRSKSNLHHCDFSQWFLMNKNKCRFVDKRCLSAEDYSLLSSALRPRLLGANSENITFRDKMRVKIASNYTKNHQKLSFFTKFDANLTNNMHFLAIFALFFGFFTVVSIYSNNNVSAASLELTVPADFNIDLDPGVGTTFGESDSQQISIKTSGSFGYTLNIKPGSDTILKNGENLIKAITKSEGYDNSDAYKNSNETNTWAYKPGKLNSIDDTKYLPFPSIDTVLAKTDASNDTANNYDLTIAAKVDNTLPSGKYSNNFVISATANTVSYSITYNLNEGEWSGESPQTGTTTDNTIKLDPNTPTKENYEFLGWCSEPTTDENCDGDIKQPGDDYKLSNGGNTINLYAIWKQSKPPTPMTMQTFGDYCQYMTETKEVLTLTDTRDGNEYKVAKLKDGKCWMVENLKIIGKAITSSDSDVGGSFSIPSSSVSSFARGDSDANNIAAYVDNYGGLYTWNTATAGTVDVSTIGGGFNATSSICPKGWKLPSGGVDSSYHEIGDFAGLVAAYGGANSTGYTNLLTKPVPGFALAGYIYAGDGGVLKRQSEWGYYWSSTTNSVRGAYRLSFLYSSVSSNDNINTVNGNSVRCLARE